jgi:hypothetical protein
MVPVMMAKPRPVEHAAVEVAHVAVGAEEVLRLVIRTAEDVDARRGPLLDVLDADERLLGVVGGQDRCKDGQKNERAQNRHADDSRPVVDQTAQGLAPGAARLRAK